MRHSREWMDESFKRGMRCHIGICDTVSNTSCMVECEAKSARVRERERDIHRERQTEGEGDRGRDNANVSPTRALKYIRI